VESPEDIALYFCIIGVVFRFFYSQTWRGGTKADYMANTICADRYLIHRPGTSFPENSFAECCTDSLFGYIGVFWLHYCDTIITYSDSAIYCDSVFVPVGLGRDTLFFGCDTLYISDTLHYFTGNGSGFITHNTFIRETLITGIDTISADTFACIFCDSVLNVTWFTQNGGDTIITDLWTMVSKPAGDSCGIVRGGFSSHHITIIDSSVTIINGDTYNYQGSWYLDYEGYIRHVQDGDTVRIRTGSGGSSGRNGVWVRDCECDSSIMVDIRGLTPFMRIDTTSWQAYFTERTYTAPDRWTLSRSPGSGLEFPYFNNWYLSVKYAEKRGTGKVSYVNFLSHNPSTEAVIGLVRESFSSSDRLLSDGMMIHPLEAFFCNADTMGLIGYSPAYSVATRRIETVPEWSCPYYGPAEHLNSATFGNYSALAVRFERVVDFRELFTDSEISAKTQNNRAGL
jgi:hypothetical protein